MGDAFFRGNSPQLISMTSSSSLSRSFPSTTGGSRSYRTPLSVRLKLDVTKFFKLHSFRPNDYFTDDALMLPYRRAWR